MSRALAQATERAGFPHALTGSTVTAECASGDARELQGLPHEGRELFSSSFQIAHQYDRGVPTRNHEQYAAHHILLAGDNYDAMIVVLHDPPPESEE